MPNLLCGKEFVLFCTVFGRPSSTSDSWFRSPSPAPSHARPAISTLQALTAASPLCACALGARRPRSPSAAVRAGRARGGCGACAARRGWAVAAPRPGEGWPGPTRWEAAAAAVSKRWRPWGPGTVLYPVRLAVWLGGASDMATEWLGRLRGLSSCSRSLACGPGRRLGGISGRDGPGRRRALPALKALRGGGPACRARAGGSDPGIGRRILTPVPWGSGTAGLFIFGCGCGALLFFCERRWRVSPSQSHLMQAGRWGVLTLFLVPFLFRV